jgi:hypothetical protein
MLHQIWMTLTSIANRVIIYYTYKDDGVYRRHLRFKHGLELKPLVKKPIFGPTRKANVNDPDNSYCIVCKKLYSTRYEYKRRLQKHQKRGEEPLKVNPDITSDLNDPDNHCKLCSTTYTYSTPSCYT